jgi:hypothetical protein
MFHYAKVAKIKEMEKDQGRYFMHGGLGLSCDLIYLFSFAERIRKTLSELVEKMKYALAAIGDYLNGEHEGNMDSTTLGDLLSLICYVSTRHRKRRMSSGPSAASLIPHCSQNQSTPFLAWSCPNNIDYQNLILVHLFSSAFVDPHQQVVVHHLKDKKQYIFCLKMNGISPLQKFVTERLGDQWTYLHTDIYSALVSKGKKISLPFRMPAPVHPSGTS